MPKKKNVKTSKKTISNKKNTARKSVKSSDKSKSNAKTGAKSSAKPLMVIKRVVYVSEPVPEQYAFHLKDGRILRNLNDLINTLDSMADDIFNYHANSEKNDFSNWIRDILEENDLSLNICGKSREDTKNEIIRFLKKRGAFKG